MPRYQSWDEVRTEADVNEAHVAAYGRIDGAERRLSEARVRRGVTDAMMAAALGVDEDEAWSVDQGDDLYLFALARHVAAAGGRLERARCSTTARRCCCSASRKARDRPGPPARRPRP